MGLKEKRATKEFREDRLESLLKQINKNAGFDVKIEIDWDTLAVDDYAHIYDECWPKVYFKPIIEAFKEMCDDDESKEIIQEGIDKIVIHNHSDNYSAEKWARFKNGVLTLNHSPITNVDDVHARKHVLMYVLEKEL